VTANFTQTGAVQVTVGTSPAGLSFSVDGTAYASTQSLTWTVGSSHTIATTSPQTSGGVQNTFSSWSDGGAISHSVTAPATAISYTASFSTAYQLTTAASPSADGTVSPVSANYYASGTAVPLVATPNSGYTFSSWTGSGVASSTSASTTLTMPAAPETVTANFAAIVVPPDYAVSSATPSQSVVPGGTAMYTIDVQSTGGTYTGSVTLSVTGLPQGATGTFNPATVTPGSAGASSTLTVTTPALASLTRPNFWPMATPVLALLFMLPFRRWRKVWKGKLLLLVAGLASLAWAASLTGCGGGFGFIQSQTYTLTITGTSGTDTHSTTVQLTVQ
jgi:uncharacterized repeat protein (TIGR02543 family)